MIDVEDVTKLTSAEDHNGLNATFSSTIYAGTLERPAN